MSDKDGFEADERDDDESADEEVESERQPAAAAPKKAATAERAQAPGSRKAAGMPSSQVGLLIVLALAAGGAGGWFGHVAQAKAALRSDSAAPSASSTGPCGSWQDKICSSSGRESAACQQAKGAAELLTPLTCEAGLLAMPATLSKVKAARAGCDKLVGKLCADLPPGSQACVMVKERTPAFPAQRCDEMLKHYDDVIGQLRQLDQQGGLPMPGRPSPVAPPH